MMTENEATRTAREWLDAMADLMYEVTTPEGRAVLDRFPRYVVGLEGMRQTGCRVDTARAIMGQLDILTKETVRDLIIITSRSTVRRKITDRYGKRYSDDMIATTANAACSIAKRNAIFGVVPMAYVKQVYEAAKLAAVGGQQTIEARRKAAVEHFMKLGVTQERILARIGVAAMEEIDLDKLATLRGLANAIKENETSIEEAFPSVAPAPNGDKTADIVNRARTTADPKSTTQTTGPEPRSKSKGRDPFAKVKPTTRTFDPKLCHDLQCGNTYTDTDTGEIKIHVACDEMQQCKKEAAA